MLRYIFRNLKRKYSKEIETNKNRHRVAFYCVKKLFSLAKNEIFGYNEVSKLLSNAIV